MTSRERFTLTSLNLAFRAYAVVALPATYGTMSNHGVLAWYFVPLILTCRFGVVVFGFVLTLAFSGIELWVGNTQAPLYGLLLLALFVGYCA